MAKTAKVVRIPVVIADQEESIRKIKYRRLDEVMSEARYLGNMAIRYAIAYSLKEFPAEMDEEGRQVPLDTRIYRILARERKFLSAASVATLERNFAVKLFRNSNKDAWVGRKSLPTYRAMFVPFRSQGTKISSTMVGGLEQFLIEPSGFGENWLHDELITEAIAVNEDKADTKIEPRSKKLILISIFSWKDNRAAEVVKRISNGEYRLRDSQIQRGRAGGLMVLLTYTLEPAEIKLDHRKVCGVVLGVVIPAACALNTGPQRRYLGSGEDLWSARSKLRSQRRRSLRREGPFSKTRRRWERSEKENAWVQTYYHTITRAVIKFVRAHGCGTIHIEDLTRVTETELGQEHARLLWAPSKFRTLLSYKAEELGIKVVKVNPQNIWIRCSGCGYIDNYNRKSQSSFVCLKCGNPEKPINADYNAARNLALAKENVIEKEYSSGEELREV